MILMFGYSQEKETGSIELINFRTFFKDKSPEEIMKVLQGKFREEEQKDKNTTAKEVQTLQCAAQTTFPWKYNITNISGDTTEIVKYPLEGRVGIGACEPEAKLHVIKRWTDDDKAFLFLLEEEEVEVPGVSSFLSRFVVTSRGNVGIHTRNPQATLDIAGSYASMYLGHKNSAHFWLATFPNYNVNAFNSSAPLWFNFTGEPVYFGFWNNGKVLIDGVLGVGTFAPQARLHVEGNAWINQGRLGVGVNPASMQDYRLAVCGKIHAQEVVVDPPGWCDYVFEEDYKLMPWDSLMDFVRTYKHLPGVPSEKEVSEKGIQVGEMNKILLKKIEELVLYNEELRKKVAELEKKVKDLEKIK